MEASEFTTELYDPWFVQERISYEIPRPTFRTGPCMQFQYTFIFETKRSIGNKEQGIENSH